MKLCCLKRRSHGLTLVEVLTVIVIVMLLACFLLPTLNNAKKEAQLISCNGNLKEINLAYRIWEGDHTNLYPMSVSTNFGGTSEDSQPDEIFRQFQVLSNEFGTPKILICPADTRQAAKDFGRSFNNTNISYFINLDATEDDPQMMFSGDDHFEIGGVRVKSGVLNIPANTPVSWGTARHKMIGNVAITDGSVQGIGDADLSRVMQSSGFMTNRILIP
jgi:competence protein ComGC